jgi:hypothetical protein
MSKKIFWALTFLLVVLTQVGLTQQRSPSVEITTNYKLELLETKIWIITQNDQWLQHGGLPIHLCLDETNPTFFALVYNTIKDHLREKKTSCYVWTTPINSATNGNYAKITQIQIK